MAVPPVRERAMKGCPAPPGRRWPLSPISPSTAAIDQAVVVAGARCMATSGADAELWAIIKDLPPTPPVVSQVKSPRIKSPRSPRGKKTALTGNDLISQDNICGQLALNPNFENAALALICVNAIWIGVDVDQRDRPGSWASASVLLLGENFFCFGFSGEILVRILAYNDKLNFFFDVAMRHWNVFDLSLVTLMVGETWLLPILGVPVDQLKFLNAIRLLRLLRISRLFRMIPELGVLFHSMVAAVRGVGYILAMLFSIMFVFAIVFTQWVRGRGSNSMAMWCVPDAFEPETSLCFEDYFGTLTHSFLALAQVLVFDDTFMIVRPMLDESLFHGLCIILYMLIACFTALNMLIAIICDIVDEVQREEREKQLQVTIKELITMMDEDESGTVSRTEFELHAVDSMRRLGLPAGLFRSAFDILDVRCSGVVQVPDFLEFVFKSLGDVEAQDLLLIGSKVERVSAFLGFERHHVAITGRERRKQAAGVSEGQPQISPRWWCHEKGWQKLLIKAAVDEAEDETTTKLQRSRRSRARTAARDEFTLDEETRSCLDRLEGVAMRVAALEAPQPVPLPLEPTMLTFVRGEEGGRLASLAKLGAALRVLNAQLHGLRAECKMVSFRAPGALLDVDRRVRQAPGSELPGLEGVIVQIMRQIHDLSASRVDATPLKLAQLELPGHLAPVDGTASPYFDERDEQY